jgi:hypothetical protein
MMFVLSVSIHLLSSSLAEIMHIPYSQAKIRYVPVAATSIREDNTSGPKIPPLDGVHLVRHLSLHFALASDTGKVKSGGFL